MSQKQFQAPRGTSDILPEEQVYWRELLPLVVRNQGFGPIYLRALEPDLEQDGVAELDSLGVMGRRYYLETTGDYILVGRDQPDESCRHVFTSGEEYLMSIAHYGVLPLDAPEVLQVLGLDSTRISKEDTAERL